MAKKRKKYGPKNDLTGQRFGHLEVLRMAHKPDDNRKEYKAVCKCHNCGKTEHWVFPYHLRKKLTTSCGCLMGNRKKGKDRSCYSGYGEITGSVWGKIKQGARRREKEFTITIREGWELFIKQDRKCSLTLLPIEMGTGRNLGTASLDRIDSSKGYIIDNIQWVHRNVNIIKHTCSQEYFLTLCRKIVNNEALKNVPNLSDEEILANPIFARGF
jgi:hypothetical protein